MNDKFFILYDFETTNDASGNGRPNPLKDEPVQLTALIIHPRKLDLVPGGKFSTFIQPPDGLTPHPESVAWHAKVKKTTPEEVLKKWKEAPPQKQVWQSFKTFLDKYHSEGGRKSIFTAPIRVGHNIIDYDNVIWQRLCERYKMLDKEGKQNLVMNQRNIDLMHMTFVWFENNMDCEDKYNMDWLREYLGMSSENAHDSEKDCYDCAEYFIRMMKLHRYVAEKTTFKGSFRKG